MTIKKLSPTLFKAFVLTTLAISPFNSQNTNVQGTVCNHFILISQEIDNILSEKTHIDSISFFSVIPERLPGWINNIPLFTGNSIYLLGISDPGMSEDLGAVVARLRIYLVYSLIMEALVGNMRDFYMRENQRSYSNSFNDYTQFAGKINFNFTDVEIIEKHLTKYDETVLLAKINIKDVIEPQDAKNKVEISSGILSNARRVGSRTELVSRSELESVFSCDGLDESIILTYKSHEVTRRVNTETLLNNETVSMLPALGLRYIVENQTETDSTLIYQMGYSLRNGLWYAYLTAIFFELADLAHGNAINISNLNEIFENQSQNLTREIVTSVVNCKQKRITLNSNNLYIYCD